MIDISKYGKNASKILGYIYKNEKVHITDLRNVVSSPSTYTRAVDLMARDGIVEIETKVIGRVTKFVYLTEKGKEICRKLDESEESTYELPPAFGDQFKGLSAMVHFNVKDDHIAIAEHNYDGSGKYRIVYVYTKPNGHNVMRLWCDVDQTFECIHTKFAWTLPDVQSMVEKIYADRVVKKNEL